MVCFTRNSFPVDRTFIYAARRRVVRFALEHLLRIIDIAPAIPREQRSGNVAMCASHFGGENPAAELNSYRGIAQFWRGNRRQSRVREQPVPSPASVPTTLIGYRLQSPSTSLPCIAAQRSAKGKLARSAPPNNSKRIPCSTTAHTNAGSSPCAAAILRARSITSTGTVSVMVRVRAS